MFSDNKNMFAAIGLSMAIIFGFSYFQKSKTPEAAQAATTAEAVRPNPVPIKPASIISRDDALSMSNRIAIENDLVKASINTQTGALDDLTLKNYKQTTAADSANIQLLNPKESKDGYFINMAADDIDQANNPIVFEDAQKVGENEIVLTGRKGMLSIKRHYILQNNYMVLITDEVTNLSDAAVKLQGAINIERRAQDSDLQKSIVHEGVIGVLDKKLKEISYKDVDKAKTKSLTATQTGWVGFTDKYWMTAAILDKPAAINVTKTLDGYTSQVYYPVEVLNPGAKTVVEYKFFAGAKELHTLETVEKEQNLTNFDMAVDFGWFYFITKPLFKILAYFYAWFGNFGIAILLLTFLSKVLLLPTAIKQQRSMNAMKKLQPKLDALKAKYANDKVRMHQETMLLYQKEKVKPMSGCLPILLQIPVFFCLYKVLSITLEMRHAPFFAWMTDLSAPDSLFFLNLFGLLPFEVPYIFQIGLMPLIMGITMFIQQRLTPTAMNQDPTQEKMMLLMPVMFTYMFAAFPVGLVLYWTWSNILSIFQQLLINKYFDKNSVGLKPVNQQKTIDHS